MWLILLARRGPRPGEGELESYTVRMVVWTLLGATEHLPITRVLLPNLSLSSQNSTTSVMHTWILVVLLLKGLWTRARRRGKEKRAKSRRG